jgi:hypothetical protein
MRTSSMFRLGWVPAAISAVRRDPLRAPERLAIVKRPRRMNDVWKHEGDDWRGHCRDAWTPVPVFAQEGLAISVT